jgi:Flp pilus assembly protein TadD
LSRRRFLLVSALLCCLFIASNLAASLFHMASSAQTDEGSTAKLKQTRLLFRQSSDGSSHSALIPDLANGASNIFSPSNARTEDGQFIPLAQFFPAARCAACHQDTHQAWAESLHRNAAREPFYKESVDILQRTRGGKASQHCEACHSPIAVFTGALLRESKEPRADDEGVSCVVCHAITEARVDGTGSYTIRRPVLLAREDGTPVFGDLPDKAIIADIPGHRRAMMRPLLKQAEFCAVCHKSIAPPELNEYKNIRGFSAYDEWQQSGASFDAVTPFYRRDRRVDCRACHMPEVESANDAAAQNGTIASHRWLGANTAAPLFYGQTKQAALTEEFLKAGVLEVDIFALRNEATGERLAPLAPAKDYRSAFKPGQEVTVEVVVSNRKAAHSFPPELRDMYEPWVEFEALDSSGHVFYHSGFIKPDQTLDESAHVYKAILLDEQSRPITRHQVWLAKIKAYDNAVPPGRSDIARYRFRLPAGADASAITLRARVNYRRFIQEYTSYVLQRRSAALDIPVVCMAQAEVKLLNQGAIAEGKQISNPSADKAALSKQAKRWNDYGIGLLQQAQYGPAAEAFRQASALSPDDPDLLISAAIAEMSTERYGFEREQLSKAAVLLDAALKINPLLPRARFYHALLIRSEGRTREAADELAGVAREHPRDREVQRQLGQTLYTLGQFAEARAAFEAILAIDPNDTGAYQFLAPLYESEGRSAEAARARSLYLSWREDPLADKIAIRFFTAHPEWADERVGPHIHGAASSLRPTLTGHFAAPDK